MKIVEVKAEALKGEFISEVIVRISTDDGAVGVGESWWGLAAQPIVAAVNDLFAPLLMGQDPDRIENLWGLMYRHGYRYGTEGVVMCALSGIDLALWDLKGKVLGRSVLSLLGGPVCDGVRAYASLPPFSGREELIRKECARAVEAGFVGIKLHETEAQAVAAARDEVGPGIALMLDPAGHWTLSEAADQAGRLAEYGLVWLEEPIFPMQDHEALLKLKSRTRIPLAAGENEYSLKAFQHLLSSGAVDFIQPEITKVGGLTAALKVGVLAELNNVAICPHCFCQGPVLYANLHWLFSQHGMEWMEIPFVRGRYSFPSGVGRPTLKDGRIMPPADLPGFGLTL